MVVYVNNTKMIKDIEDFPGYGVDENGNVYSRRKRKPIQDKYGVITGQTVYLTDDWRKLKTHLVLGYEYVCLCRNSEKMTRRVHILVAKAFIPNPNNEPYVCHNDGSKTNNHVSNLRWDSSRNNQLDRQKHGTTILTRWKIEKLQSLYTEGEITKKAISVIYKLPMHKVDQILTN